jgi:two-component system alkaline phosphatase synthesis response regulator PhoP
MKQSSHILIIDDETSLCQTLARILQRAGFDVTTAANAKDGIALISQHAFDLVYMDIRMPDISGLDALKAIRSKMPELSVILFTAQPDVNSAIQALRNGASDYLLKPLKPETIIECTKTTLAKLEREKRRKEIRAQIKALEAELKALDIDAEPAPGPEMEADSASNRYLRRGKLILDLHARRATVGARTINLPPAAFDYLLVLARHAPNVVDYQTLVAEAQGYEASPRDAQELAKWHIHHIRDELEENPRDPALIITVRGSGYRLIAD